MKSRPSFRRRPATSIAAALGLLLLSLGTASAFADDLDTQSPGSPTSEQIIQEIESESSQSIHPGLTDPYAAESLPHRDLDRDGALELLQGVFEAQLQSPAGIFDELQVEKFLSPDVAVIAGDDSPTAVPATEKPEGEEFELPAPMIEKEELRAGSSAETEGEFGSPNPDATAGMGQIEGTALLDSSVPLRIEAPSGEQETIDLGLERSEGELQPENPLVDVGIPERLGEGIHLPGADVTITIAGAPEERSPSIVEESVAFLPNVATDTDFAVVPTPTGVETFTHLRSPDSPRSQTFDLELPQGALLQAREDGGAVVVQGGETILAISSPTAIDATGADVPVSLDVSGAAFTLTTSPDATTTYPILVDPLIQTYEWANSPWYQSGICNSSHETIVFNSCNNREEWGYELYDNSPYNIQLSNHIGDTTGLFIGSSGTLTTGEKGSINYTVPRYYTDQEKYGVRPTSFISKMTLWKLNWTAHSSSPSPYVVAGLWDSVNGGSVSYYSHEGLTGHSVQDLSWQYQFPNPNGNKNVKIGYASLQATETQPNSNASLYVGSAAIELADDGIPGFGSVSGPSGWVNQTASPISFTVSDSGLGVRSLTASTQQLTDEDPPPHSWKTLYGCKGVAGAACPRTWASTEADRPALKYEPSVMPTGISYLSVVAEDPVGNKSAPANVQVKVDHTVPQVALSGTMTEQATLGAKRPSYTLRVDASDGTAEQPQSGVAKTVVKVDGTVVDEAAPGCATKNCAISREWTLDSSKYSAGQHTVTVTATDAVGLSSAPKSLTINLEPSPPSLDVSGSITEQASLGTSRPRYKLNLSASAIAGAEAPQIAQPTFVSSFGSAGAGNGQFNHPAGVAVDGKGNVWVVDQNADRVEKFSQAGSYLSAFGSSGTGNGQFGRPTSIAIDANGNLWVTDAGNHRVQKFNEKGEYLTKFGSLGSGSGQFSSPEGIAIDPNGSLWVADTYNGRLQQFTSNGAFVRVVGSKGSAQGQLGEPTDLDVGPGGSVWVADWQNGRVAVFDEEGEFVRQFGTEGTGDGQFKRPDVIEVDSMGNVWVGDEGNGRIQAFNQSGEYVAKLGTKGSGQGQFSFSWPMGITTDSKGSIWVADTANNRVQRWQIPNYVPTYASAFGSYGSANGQFNSPGGVAADSRGNVWVVDKANNRVQRFNSKGEFVSKFGSYGVGNGQLDGPSDIAVGPEGNLWVTDSGNNRVQKFSESGEYLSKFGSLGSSNGQFKEPVALAIHHGNGLIYVADRGNHRVQLFGKGGAYWGQVGSYGSGALQFKEPSGIAIGGPSPESPYTLFVADSGNHRVQKLTNFGIYLDQFGSQGAGEGQFDRPEAIDVDPLGNVWIADRNNGRVQKLNEAGEYITHFGTKGSGPGQFSFGWPSGVATDYKGNIWVADTGNNRVQRWSQPDFGSDIITEVTVDGKLVDAGEAGCLTEHCSIAREWTLPSSAYSVGNHTVATKATDGLGNTSSKSLTVNIQRDTIKPTLQSSGELVEAPEGWVEQESYGLNASASDSGHGVTSLAFKIDGKQVASVGQACADGACNQSLTKSVDMSTYEGGAHPAELVATDGAGNASTKSWTINVDPEGHITAIEAEDTLEAADTTSDSTVVVPTSALYDAQERADGNDPSLVKVDDSNDLESRGTSNLSVISAEPEDGFTIVLPESTLHAEPTDISENSTPMVIAEEAAAVVGNTRSNVDSVVRPMFNGVTTFQSIRDIAAPEIYSWEVSLGEGQTLRSVDPLDAEVVYEDGTRAMLIVAERAHDAVGTNVPTSLSVSGGNLITLTVAHRQGSFVYPIIAGSGWEGGYTTEVVIGPKDEQELKEERERIAREEWEQMERGAEEEMAEGPADESPGQYDQVKTTGPYSPRRMYVAVEAPEMWDWEQRKRRSKFERADYCASWTCEYWHTWEWGTWFWNGRRGQIGGYAWRGNTAAKCATEADHPLMDTTLHSVGWSGPNPAPYGYGKYLNFWCNFRWDWWGLGGQETNYYQIQSHLYGSGYEGAHIKENPPPVAEG